MDLFFLRALLRRQLLTTPKFEAAMEQTRLDAERYRKVEQSDKMREFLQLEKEVNTPAFQDKKKELTQKKYTDSDEKKKLDRLKQLSRDKFVRQYLKNGEGENRSSVMQYVELKKETDTDEFRRQNAFWQDAHRWDTTEEGKKDARYQAFLQDDDIRFFRSADQQAIERYERFEKVYEDDFNWSRLESSDWRAGAQYPSEAFVSGHSYTNEKQAYNSGRNTETADSILHIKTIQEKLTTPAWDEKKGMVMKEFDYSSDLLSTDKVAIEEGMVVQVKARCRGFLNHGVYLRSKKHVPLIHLFDYTGLKLYVGAKDSIKSDQHLKMLDGVQPINYIIFTVSWQKDEIVWFMNNMEVYRTKNLMPKGEKLYLHLFSFVPENARRKAEGELQIDWVRIYKTK